MKHRLFSIFLLLSVLLSPSPVLAQTSALALSPSVIEVLLAPNKNFTQEFTLKNQGKSGNFVINLHHIEASGSEGHVKLDPTPLDLTSLPLLASLNNGLVFNEPFFLESGKSQIITLRLEGASVDTTMDIYLALTIQAANPGIESTFIAPGISSLILLTLTPDSAMMINLQVENFDLPALHDTAKALPLSPVLVNQGNTMLRPGGYLQILDPRGQEIARQAIYNNLILSSSKRIIQGINQRNYPLPLTYSPSPLAFGPYTLRLVITTQSGSKILELDRVIWMLPLSNIMIGLIAIILMILLIYLKKKSFPTKKLSH